MAKRKIPKVNMYDAELKLEKLVEQAQKDKHIKKPISWALYQTWKWADANEEEKRTDKGVLEKINEKQDSLRTTCKAWDEAIQKDGYVN